MARCACWCFCTSTLVDRHYPGLRDVMTAHDCMDAGGRTTQGAVAEGKPLPLHVQQEFADYLKCGRLENGFLRVQCTHCHHEHLVAYSWPFLRIHAPIALVNPFTSPRRGFSPSCGARRMAESAALLVDEVLPEQPIRQWVLSFPFQLRFIRRIAEIGSGHAIKRLLSY
jgi:hypothetical protein